MNPLYLTDLFQGISFSRMVGWCGAVLGATTARLVRATTSYTRPRYERGLYTMILPLQGYTILK